MQKKRKINKKLVWTTCSLLTIGLTGSIVLSQVSFATNSFDNSIKLLNDEKSMDATTYATNLKPQSSAGAGIGLGVGNYSPFVVKNGSGTWNTSQYIYYPAPNLNEGANLKEGDKFDPATSKSVTNPGVAFAWYPSSSASNSAAGPGMITFYTRQLEDNYEFYKNLKVPGLNGTNVKTLDMDLFRKAFFEDINTPRRDTAFLDFINSMVSKANNYGSPDPISVDQVSEYGSLFATMLFNKNNLYQDVPEIVDSAPLPNINLRRLMFYPTGASAQASTRAATSLPIPTADTIGFANTNNPDQPAYSYVWQGNEHDQEGTNTNDANNPLNDYRGVRNSAFSRAMTLGNFTLVSKHVTQNKTYMAQGDIKFRIFYQYDFKATYDQTTGNRSYQYDVNDFTPPPGDESPDGQFYFDDYVKRTEITDPSGGQKFKYELNNAKMQYLLFNNIDKILKNFKYVNPKVKGDLARWIHWNYNPDFGEVFLNEDESTLYLDGFDINNFTIDKVRVGDIQEGDVVYVPKEDRFDVSFPVTIDVVPTITRKITIKFHKTHNTILKSTKMVVNYPNRVTTSVSEAEAKIIIQDNLTQIFNNIAPDCAVKEITGFDNTTKVASGVITFKTITLTKAYMDGVVVEQTFQTTNDSGAQTNIEISGFLNATGEEEEKLNTHLSPTIKITTPSTDPSVPPPPPRYEYNIPSSVFTTIDDLEVSWSNVLPETLSREIVNPTTEEDRANNAHRLLLIQALKKLLIEQEILLNPFWANPILVTKPAGSYNDIITIDNVIDFQVSSFNNQEGWIQVSFSLNKYYENGLFIDATKPVVMVGENQNQPTPPAPKNFQLKITGFYSLAVTTLKKEQTFQDSVNVTDTDKKFAYDITPDQIINAFNKILQDNGGMNAFFTNPIDTFIKDSAYKTLNPWISNTSILIDSIKDPNNTNAIQYNALEGYILVSVPYKWVSTSTGVIQTQEPPESQVLSFKLTGYWNQKDNPEKFTTEVKSGKVKNITKYTPYNITENPAAETEFKAELINQKFITNIANNQTITPEEITILNPRPINKEGKLICDIQLPANKVWESTVIQTTPKTFANVEFTGFRIQQPSEFVKYPAAIKLDNLSNQAISDLGKSDLSFVGCSEFNDDSIQTLIAKGIKEQLNNDAIQANNFVYFPYSGAKVYVKLPQNLNANVNLITSTVNIYVKIEGIYDAQGNPAPSEVLTPSKTQNDSYDQTITPTENGFTTYTITGFGFSNTSTTTISNFELTGWQDKVASDYTSGPNKQVLVDAITQAIVGTPNDPANPPKIHNTNPLLGNFDAQAIVQPSFDSFQVDNWNGKITTKVTIKAEYCLIDGVVQTTNQTFDITISGFKHLESIKIANINNDTTINKNQNVNAFFRNENTIPNIQRIVYESLNANMFPDGLPPINYVNVKPLTEPGFFDALQGFCSVEISIGPKDSLGDTMPYRYASTNELGELIINEGPFTEVVRLSGFIPDSNSTRILNGYIKTTTNDPTGQLPRISELIPEDLQDTAQPGKVKPEYNDIIEQGLIDSKLIVNTTKNELTVNDIASLAFVNYNNLEGSATFDITLAAGIALVNGNPSQNQVTFKNVVLSGFRVLESALIPTINLSSAELPSDFVKNWPAGEPQIQQYILDQLNPNMFPNGMPLAHQIMVELSREPNATNDKEGTIQINVVISGMTNNNTPLTYVSNDDLGTIVDSNVTPLSTKVTLNGFKKKSDSWLNSNSFIILISVVGGLLLIVLLVVLFYKIRVRFGVNI